jgi:hypothetical protein
LQAFVLTLSYRGVMPGSAPVAGKRMCPYRVRPNERGYDAIAGIHRLEAAKQLDWTMMHMHAKTP